MQNAGPIYILHLISLCILTLKCKMQVQYYSWYCQQVILPSDFCLWASWLRNVKILRNYYAIWFLCASWLRNENRDAMQQFWLDTTSWFGLRSIRWHKLPKDRMKGDWMLSAARYRCCARLPSVTGPSAFLWGPWHSPAFCCHISPLDSTRNRRPNRCWLHHRACGPSGTK